MEIYSTYSELNVCLPLLNIMSVKSIHIVICIDYLCVFFIVVCFITPLYHNLFIQSMSMGIRVISTILLINYFSAKSCVQLRILSDTLSF